MDGAESGARAETRGPPITAPEPLRAALDSLNIGLGIFDTDLILIYKNETFQQLRAYPIQNATLQDLSDKLSRYLSPQIYASIFSGKQTAELSAERKMLTVCFSDIINFTGMTEELEPEELTTLLNDYIAEMTAIALRHGGTIDKYVGDAIIVFFGDPESRGAKVDARACVEMGIAMQRRMRALYSDWRALGLDSPFRIRIGICTGYCTVGNFGSADRMAYTIIGHPVNLAARLQSHAEAGGILISNKTHALVREHIKTEEQDMLRIKGLQKTVRTHKVVDVSPEADHIFRHETKGLRISVDLGKLDRAQAAAALRNAIAKLDEY